MCMPVDAVCIFFRYARSLWLQDTSLMNYVTYGMTSLVGHVARAFRASASLSRVSTARFCADIFTKRWLCVLRFVYIIWDISFYCRFKLLNKAMFSMTNIKLICRMHSHTDIRMQSCMNIFTWNTHIYIIYFHDRRNSGYLRKIINIIW